MNKIIILLYSIIITICTATCFQDPNCLPKCLPGMYSELQSGTCMCPVCTVGSYCPLNDGNMYFAGRRCLCPIGTYNPNNHGSSLSSCIGCPPGSYCQYEETVTPYLCSENTYNPSTGASSSSSCIPCPNNTASIAGSTSISALYYVL